MAFSAAFAEVPFNALRVGSAFTDEGHWPGLRAALEAHRTAFDEVWLSTGVTFPSLTWHTNQARRCAAAAEDLRRLGIAKGLHDGSGCPVRLRPGNFAYWDFSAHDQIHKAYELADLLVAYGTPDWIEARCPEIESCPRAFSCRTPQGLILEAFENPVELALVRAGGEATVRLPQLAAWTCGYLAFD